MTPQARHAGPPRLYLRLPHASTPVAASEYCSVFRAATDMLSIRGAESSERRHTRAAAECNRVPRRWACQPAAAYPAPFVVRESYAYCFTACTRRAVR